MEDVWWGGRDGRRGMSTEVVEGGGGALCEWDGESEEDQQKVSIKVRCNGYIPKYV